MIPKSSFWERACRNRKVVHPDHESVESGHFTNKITNGVVKDPGRLVKRTYSYAVVAIHPVFDPEEKTGLGIDIPL